jgi:putative tryptophan/tyrosine transport system ATP-binding protein
LDIGRLILDALVAGMPYSFNFLGIWLIFRLLNDFDLTVDGSFTLGAAVTAALITNGTNPVLATVVAVLSGATAGLFTAFVHLRLRVILLLAGIITMIALYSVNLRIMGLPNVSFLGHSTIFSRFQAGDPVTSDLKVLALVLGLLVVVALALGFFLKTEIGLGMRATGANPQMARTVGINTSLSVLMFLVLANALVGLSGAVAAQQQFFSDINMGIGVILIGITAILLGEIFLQRTGSVWFGIAGVVLGTAIYHIAVAIAVRAGLQPTDLRAFTSALLLLAIGISLALGRGKGWLRLRKRAASILSGATTDYGEAIPRLVEQPLIADELLPGADSRAVTAEPTARPPRHSGLGRSRGNAGAALGLSDLHVIYNQGLPNETHALRGLTLDIPAGQFLTVIGSNGAGKSTFVSAIAGAVPLAAGSVRLDERNISKQSEHQRARHVARVFQDPLAGTCPEFSVDENLALAAKRGATRGFEMAVTKSKRRQFSEYLAGFGLGLEDRLTENVGRLSGGQRQALSILMAVIRTPDVLLLDEHTAALDPRNQTLLLEMTNELVRETRCTTVMITHNMDQAIRYGDRMIMLHRGRLLFDVAGEQKQQLSLSKLVELFHRGDDTVITDEMLLA